MSSVPKLANMTTTNGPVRFRYLPRNKMGINNGVIIAVLLGLFMILGSANCKQPEELKKVTKLMKQGPDGGEYQIGENYEFQIFCRKADPKRFYYYFRTATLRLLSPAEDIKLIRGYLPENILREYKETSRWTFWMANFLPWRARDTTFPTFNASCIGVVTSRPYTAVLLVKPVDMWKVATLTAGMILFLYAPELTQSSVFFYSGGTLLGAVGTVLVFLYFVYRFLPKSKTGIFSMTVLWSIITYVAGETWSRLEELLQSRLPYIIGLVTVGSVMSFIACYRFGPPSNRKTIVIYKSLLQFIGLILIHWSSDLLEMSSAIIILCIVWYFSNDFIKTKFTYAWYKLMPYRRKTRFLTEAEFIEQGAEETVKELEKLKSFCSSPDANPWKIMSRLKDPKKFSSFVSGDGVGVHLSDEEILAHDVFVNESMDDDDSEVDEEINNARFGRTLRQDTTTQGRHVITPVNNLRINDARRGRMSVAASSVPNRNRAQNGRTRSSLPPPPRGTIYPNLTNESILTDDEEPQLNFETDDDD